MHSPLFLEAYAQDVIRERLEQVARDALVAQLPRSPLARPDLAIRLRVANGLRALAIRLDPCSALEQPSLLSMSSR
jgi:hypothetical protein